MAERLMVPTDDYVIGTIDGEAGSMLGTLDDVRMVVVCFTQRHGAPLLNGDTVRVQRLVPRPDAPPTGDTEK